MTSSDAPSVPSTSTLNHTSSLNHTLSVRSNKPSAIVITSPPWAKDEPPSPTEQAFPDNSLHAVDPRPSDVISYHSSHDDSHSRWWAFTLPRPRESLETELLPNNKSERKSFRDRSVSWRPREVTSFSKRLGEKTATRDWNLSITLPTPSVQHPFTVAHNATPGWETPWTSRPEAQGPLRDTDRESLYGLGTDPRHDSDNSSEKSATLDSRKKRFRRFLLDNNYVPLLFRLINISFTTAALGVAIRIRRWEAEQSAMGAVGSSPTLVIIFAPLTLVHVMMAIYLEYFGKPLGLWRTSAKLFHTLSEVVFICAWSAALSLCFDNFFTSLVPCASWSSISWYNQLPRPPSNIPNFEGSVGDRICDYQLALISLVFMGLLMYCTNLVISLFRIFEKVKYHPTRRI